MGHRRARRGRVARREQEPASSRPARSRCTSSRSTVFNKADTPPFEIADDIDTSEEKRLAVSLPRSPPRAAPALAPRAPPHQRRRRAATSTSQGFLELETPFMVKYTPGGARNFLVPSAPAPGQVLRARREPAALQAALHGRGVRPVLPDRQVLPRRGPAPRSPARVHADRRRDVVRQPGRRLPHDGGARLLASGRTCSAIDLNEKYPSGRFPQMPFEESMASYGNDKPDLRFGMQHTDLTDADRRARRRRRAVLEGHRRQVRERRIPARPADRDRQGAARPGRAPTRCRAPSSTSSRSSSRAWAPKGLARAKIDAEGNWTQSPLAKTITPELRAAINAATGREGRRPARLPVRQGEHRADGDGEPARPPREEAGAHPRVRARREVRSSSGS